MNKAWKRPWTGVCTHNTTGKCQKPTYDPCYRNYWLNTGSICCTFFKIMFKLLNQQLKPGLDKPSMYCLLRKTTDLSNRGLYPVNINLWHLLFWLFCFIYVFHTNRDTTNISEGLCECNEYWTFSFAIIVQFLIW